MILQKKSLESFPFIFKQTFYRELRDYIHSSDSFRIFQLYKKGRHQILGKYFFIGFSFKS
jgi:hypothetical protein